MDGIGMACGPEGSAVAAADAYFFTRSDTVF